MADPVSQDPLPGYFQWAQEGFENDKPFRFPMGPGAKPLYSLWNGQRLSYVDARKCIYCPTYADLVVGTDAFRRLQTMLQCGRYRQIWLRDFDGYDEVGLGMTLLQVVEEPRLKMGHAFVLKALLLGLSPWKEGRPVQPIIGLVPLPGVEEHDANKEERVSCGILCRSRGRYLVCRTTRSVCAEDVNEAIWTIPKGLKESGESQTDAAIRETREETGLCLRPEQLKAEPRWEFSVGRGKGKKVVLVFFVEDDSLMDLPLHCSSLIDDHFRTPVNVRGLPEVDAFEWVTWEEAKRRVFPSQRAGIFESEEPK